jgi:hypothetical protein
MEPKMVAQEVPGYTYGAADVPRSSISLSELDQLKQSAGFTEQDERYLRSAGEVLAGQTKALVDTWRGIIAKIPHLAKHSKDAAGRPIARYSERSGLRFEQWILDTCFREYDQDWLNYQQEIALRHTAVQKNQTDGVESTPYIPLRHVIAFAAVINETIRPFLAAKGHSAEEVQRMHSAWSKSLQLQVALWAEPYTDPNRAPKQW